MSKNFIKDKLDNDIPVLGLWSIVPSSTLTEIYAISGFDFVILDMEHGVYDVTSLDAGIKAAEAHKCAPLVRIPKVDPPLAQVVLDMGCYGLVVPQIDNRTTAEQVVGISKFYPAGRRGYNPFTRVALYSNPQDSQQGKLNNSFGLTTIIVESKAGIDNLDEILNVDMLDVIYLGIYDLSVALGYSGNTKHPDLIKLVEDAVVKIRSKGKVAGLMVSSESDMKRAIAIGARFLVWSVDSYIIKQRCDGIVSDFKNAMGILESK